MRQRIFAKHQQPQSEGSKRNTEETARMRRRVLYWIAAAALPVIALLLAAAFVVLCIAYTKVSASVTIELGGGSPPAAAFSRDGSDVAYAKEPEALYETAGKYRLRIKTGVLTVPVTLRVVDTVAPRAEGRETTVSALETLTPDKLIKNLRDESIVKVAYETEPEYGTVGDYDAVVLLEDASGNQTRVPVKVHVRIAVDELTMEAGEKAPVAEDFLIDRYSDVQMDPITDRMMQTPGSYPVRITADGTETESVLTVRDTVPPKAEGVTFVAAPGEPVEPEDLVSGVEDETAVTAAFETEPDFKSLVPQTVGVVLTDLGGNKTTVYGTLLISGVAPVEIEAHSEPLKVEELQLGEGYTEARISWQFIPNVPGLHVIIVLLDGQENYALIRVKDIVAPTIEVQRTTGFIRHPLPAEAFASAADVSEVKLGYLSEPDWSKEIQDVTLIAEDAAGNRTEQTFTLTLAPDTEPPEIYGVVDRTAYVGEPIVYLSEVYAEDNADGLISVDVQSEVRQDTPGDYRVVYTAEDEAGNRTSAECIYTLVAATVSETEVRTLAQEVLKKITTDRMVTAEKLLAVFEYVREHMYYVGHSDKSDWRMEAVRGFKTGKGDCFTFYAITRALLDELGVEYMSVTRLGGRTRHYWTIVNIGTGWYHYDTTISSTHRSRCFMWTNEQCMAKPAFWRFDQSKYPDIATEPFDYKAVVQLEKEGLLP
jgi:hypothetical protein